jgi:hypothetical protein
VTEPNESATIASVSVPTAEAVSVLLPKLPLCTHHLSPPTFLCACARCYALPHNHLCPPCSSDPFYRFPVCTRRSASPSPPSLLLFRLSSVHACYCASPHRHFWSVLKVLLLGQHTSSVLAALSLSSVAFAGYLNAQGAPFYWPRCCTARAWLVLYSNFFISTYMLTRET